MYSEFNKSRLSPKGNRSYPWIIIVMIIIILPDKVIPVIPMLGGTSTSCNKVAEIIKMRVMVVNVFDGIISVYLIAEQ